MIRKITLLTAVFFFYLLGVTNTLHAQMMMVLPDVDACPGDVINIPVLVEDFDGIGSITMAIDYDEQALNYTGHVNPHTALSSGSFLTNAFDNNGQMQVRASWYWIFPADIGTDTLVELIFEVKCAATTLSFDLTTPGVNEITDEFANLVTAGYVNGNLNIEDITPTITAPLDGTIEVLTTPLITWDQLQTSCSPTSVVQISDDMDFSNLVVDETGIVGNSYSASGLEPNTAYYCRVGTDSCSTWSGTIMFTTGLSLAEDNILDVYIYPNPAKDMVGVNFITEMTADIRIQLLDVLGNEILVKRYVNLDPGSQESKFEINEIPSGVYLINIDIENKNKQISNVTRRIIKK